jgi:GMP synthase (glutamine-hydrolysing)
MSKVWVLQHVHCETLGTIVKALGSRGILAEYIRSFEGRPVPKEMEGASGLIVMGGPMGVYECPSYPFLSDEMRLIERALQEEKPVLGVCLGSQLLAAVLGAAVTKGKKKEIGWHPVLLKEAASADRLWRGAGRSFTAFHWHGDIFELPRGSVSLASSELTEHQAFRYRENAYGLLFHMEVTEAMIREMVKTFSDELAEAGTDGGGIIEGARNHLADLHRIGETVFGRWADLIAPLMPPSPPPNPRGRSSS